MDKAKTKWTSTFKQVDELKDDQYYMMNEEIQHDGWAFFTSGTSFNSRDEYHKDLDQHQKSLREEDGNEDNVAAPDVHQRGGDINLQWKKDLWGSL
jgi:hypothetical protein